MSVLLASQRLVFVKLLLAYCPLSNATLLVLEDGASDACTAETCSSMTSAQPSPTPIGETFSAAKTQPLCAVCSAVPSSPCATTCLPLYCATCSGKSWTFAQRTAHRCMGSFLWTHTETFFSACPRKKWVRFCEYKTLNLDQNLNLYLFSSVPPQHFRYTMSVTLTLTKQLNVVSFNAWDCANSAYRRKQFAYSDANLCLLSQ